MARVRDCGGFAATRTRGLLHVSQLGDFSRARPLGPYPLQDVVIEPPLQRPRPPFVVAARGPRALRVAARYADTWNTLGGQPMRSESPEPVALGSAVAETRRQIEQLDRACVEVGRDPRTLRRSVLVYRYDPFASVDAFHEYVARYEEVGIDEFIFYWPADPQTFAAAPEREATLERIAADVLPKLRPRRPEHEVARRTDQGAQQ